MVIDDEATIFQSTILDQSYVGQLVNIENRIVYKNLMIDANTAERTEVVDEFLLGEAHPALIALSALVEGMKRSRQLEGDLRLCNLQQPVRMIFELTRLDRAFEIFSSEEEAIQAFS